MSYDLDERSIDSGNPIELYLFTYNENTYSYTSGVKSYTYIEDGVSYEFNPDFIQRSDNLKLGNSNGTQETCTVTVARNNNVALLYQGAPPEQDSVRLRIYRVHGDISADYIKILDGVVSQVAFKDSTAEMTINIESVLKRNIPKGSLSYYCQNVLFDNKCCLDANNFGKKFHVDKIDHLTIRSQALADEGDNYYTDGFIKMGNAYRQIRSHIGNTIVIKYPIGAYDRAGSFVAYPGCNGLFSVCHNKFNNINNFSGVPYIQKYDAFVHPVDKGAYWINSEVILRDTHGRILG